MILIYYSSKLSQSLSHFVALSFIYPRRHKHLNVILGFRNIKLFIVATIMREFRFI